MHNCCCSPEGSLTTEGVTGYIKGTSSDSVMPDSGGNKYNSGTFTTESGGTVVCGSE